MRQPDLFFSDANCEIRVSGDEAVVHDRTRDRYLRTSVTALPIAVRSALRAQHPRVTMPLVGAITAMIVAGWLALLVVTSTGVRPGPNVVMSTAFVLITSIAVHEAAHVLTLHAFGKKIDRVGVKLNHWVFPAVYVRMSQSIMLARSQQALVHVAGIGANVVTLALTAVANALVWHNGSIAEALHITTVLLGWNLLPLLGSDGYRVLLAFCSTDVAQHLRNNPTWLNLIRLASVLVAAAAATHLFLTLLG